MGFMNLIMNASNPIKGHCFIHKTRKQAVSTIFDEGFPPGKDHISLSNKHQSNT